MADDIKRMTFGSNCRRRDHISSGATVGVWIHPKKGRWLVESLKAGGGYNWEVAGLHLLSVDPERFDEMMIANAIEMKIPETQLFGQLIEQAKIDESILGPNRIDGWFGAGALADGVPLEAEEIVIGRETRLVVLLRNITAGALMAPAIAAICQRVER